MGRNSLKESALWDAPHNLEEEERRLVLDYAKMKLSRKKKYRFMLSTQIMVFVILVGLACVGILTGNGFHSVRLHNDTAAYFNWGFAAFLGFAEITWVCASVILQKKYKKELDDYVVSGEAQLDFDNQVYKDSMQLKAEDFQYPIEAFDGMSEEVKPVDETLKYYNENATRFVQGTVSVDFRETQDRFLRELKPGDHILDFGCGSGRDTKYFLEKGYQVDAIDGSRELCRIASDYTGITVRNMLFDELDAKEKYDGIWACASILHLPKAELKMVFRKMISALKAKGIIYTSFKCGIFEGERNERFFTDFTIDSFGEFIDDIEGIAIEDYWITGDVRPGREEEKWLNLLLRKA